MSVARLTRVAWIIALLLFGWLMIFPIFAGIVVANDDLKFVRGSLNVGSLGENILHGWSKTGSFRPLENIVASFCDARTMSCWILIPVQFCGFAVVALGIVALMRRVLPECRFAAPLVLIWVSLSPSTMTSLWQMDTCSQTWVAALGLWCAVLSWDAFVAGQRASPDRAGMWRSLLLLFAVTVIAMNIKETFFGWSAAIGSCCILVVIVRWRRDVRAALRGAFVLVPIAVVPMIYLALRYKFGSIGSASVASETEDGRYQVVLEDNILSNAVKSLFAMFCDGPLHQLMNQSAMIVVRMLPVTSVIASCVLLLAACALCILQRRAQRTKSLRWVLLAAMVCMASICVTLPMGDISDLYAFGPNIGSGLLLVIAAVVLWNPVDANDRAITRSIAACATAILCVVGVYGVASRSYHFSMTWQYATEINNRVLAHQASLPIGTVADEPARIFVPRSCYTGHAYGQVVVGPVQSMGIESITDWVNSLDPRRQIQFVEFYPIGFRAGVDLEIDCAKFPVRENW